MARYNRMDFIRVLKVVKSIGKNEVVFQEDGKFGIASEDGASLVFGNGVKFGRKVGLIDVDMLIGMLNGFTDVEVNIEFEDNKMIITGGRNLVFGYRLATPELIESYEDSKLKEIEAEGKWVNRVFQFEQLMEIKNLITSLGSDKISFLTEEGKFCVVIGDKKTFYGKLELGDLNIEGRVDFVASKIRGILDVLDESKINISLRVKTKKAVIFKERDFVWVIGGLVEKE